MFCRNLKAFTLIELLVVISIIAVLLSILMPALQIAKQKAAGVVCMSNLNNMGKAWYAYTSENDSKMVSANTGYNRSHWVVAPLTDTGIDITKNTYQVAFKDSEIQEKINGIMEGALYPFLKDPKVYHCPGDRRSKTAPKKGGSGKGAYRTYSIPGGMNGGGGYSLKKITQLKTTQNKYTFIEEMDGRGINLNSWVMDLSSPKWIDPLGVWHNNSSTFAFADGHAETRRWHGKKLIEMTENESFYSGTLTEPADIEDYEFMKRRFATKDNL